jgi:hypothetical protein
MQVMMAFRMIFPFDKRNHRVGQLSSESFLRRSAPKNLRRNPNSSSVVILTRSKTHASSGIARVELKQILSFWRIRRLRVSSDGSVDQFANNKYEKKLFLTESVLKARQTMSPDYFTFHFERSSD